MAAPSTSAAPAAGAVGPVVWLIEQRMEGPGRPAFEGVYKPASRKTCHANVLNDTALLALVRFWSTGNKRRVTLNAVTVYTGGRADGVTAHVTSLDQGKIGSGIAYDQIKAYRTSVGLATPKQINMNVNQVMWRLSNPIDPNVSFDAAGERRKIPVGVEISHCAESYHFPATFAALSQNVIANPQFKVELTVLEAAEVNESRKTCTRFMLMWRRADNGKLIYPSDNYVGPTLCIHGACGGIPCYAPPPMRAIDRLRVVLPDGPICLPQVPLWRLVGGVA